MCAKNSRVTAVSKKFKVGDKVEVIAGSDKGKQGEVMRMLPRQGLLFVSGVRLVKKRPKNRRLESQDHSVSSEAAISCSNVAHVDPETGKIGKIGLKYLDDMKKVRYFKASGKILDIAKVK